MSENASIGKSVSNLVDSITSSPYGKAAIAAIAVVFIGLGGYMIIKNLVGLLEGFGGLVLIIIGIFLLSLVA